MQNYRQNNYPKNYNDGRNKKYQNGTNEQNTANKVTLQDANLSSGNIILITKYSDANSLLTELHKEKLIGLDSEWDNTLDSKGTAIIQIATRKFSYIIDLITIYEREGKNNYLDLGLQLKKLFSNKNVIKVAFSFKEDLKNLSYSFNDQFEIESLCDLYHEIKTRDLNQNFGLKKLCNECFGKELDKTCQRSKWSLRPLSKQQMIYAGLDAFILLPLYDKYTQKPLYLKYYATGEKSRADKDREKQNIKGNNNFERKGSGDFNIRSKGPYYPDELGNYNGNNYYDRASKKENDSFNYFKK